MGNKHSRQGIYTYPQSQPMSYGPQYQTSSQFVQPTGPSSYTPTVAKPKYWMGAGGQSGGYGVGAFPMQQQPLYGQGTNLSQYQPASQYQAPYGNQWQSSYGQPLNQPTYQVPPSPQQYQTSSMQYQPAQMFPASGGQGARKSRKQQPQSQGFYADQSYGQQQYQPTSARSWNQPAQDVYQTLGGGYQTGEYVKIQQAPPRQSLSSYQTASQPMYQQPQQLHPQQSQPLSQPQYQTTAQPQQAVSGTVTNQPSTMRKTIDKVFQSDAQQVNTPTSPVQQTGGSQQQPLAQMTSMPQQQQLQESSGWTQEDGETHGAAYVERIVEQVTYEI